MRVYDITMPLEPGVAVWPGDAAYEWHWTWKMADGATVNVGQVRLSVHVGTHTDAPFHFHPDGATVDRLALEPFFGRARVVDVRNRDRIRPADLANTDLTSTPRVLFRTDAWLDRRCFPESIPVIDESVPALLAKAGIVLVGIDVPSVDALSSQALPVHHALAAAKIHILESLALEQIPEGVYTLIALPMKLVGADGAPVRAVLCEE